MSATVESLIAYKLIEFINDNLELLGLPCRVMNNEHPKTGEALWIQPNSGQRKTRQYIGGSYKGFFPFTMCYQLTNPENMEGRRAALDLPFFNAAVWFEGQLKGIALDGETTVSIEMATTPAPSMISEDGQTVEHSAVFRMDYHVKSPVMIAQG